MRLEKRIFRYFYEQVVLFAGYLKYLLTGANSQRAFQAMIYIFCLDKGSTNDLYCKLIGIFKKPYKFKSPVGIFGNLDEAQLKKIQSELEEKGYSIAEVLVSEEFCNKMQNLALVTVAMPAKLNSSDPTPKHTLYDPDNIQSPKYSFMPQSLMNEESIQDLMADPTLLAISNNYFKSKPALDSVIMSVSTDFSNEACEEAAQHFHFDMDRIKWLKFFIYLSDVSEKQGPHVFVEGTHKTYGIPKEILNKGYARIQDEEVFQHFSKAKIKEFVCRRGTIFVEDTRGLHKGTVLSEGRRMLLQVQYNINMFGPTNLKPFKIPKLKSDRLKQMLKQYPAVYKNFELVE